MAKKPGKVLGSTPSEGPSISDVESLMKDDLALTDKEDQAFGAKVRGDKGLKKPKPIKLPNAKRWLDRIHRSKKVQKDFVEDRARFIRWYQGDYSEAQNKLGKKPAKGGTRAHNLSINILYSHIEIITPSVFSGFPFVRPRPKPKSGVSIEQANQSAYHMELVLNYWLKELEVDLELKDAFRDSFFGDAAIELGWETQIEEHHEEIEDENALRTADPDVTDGDDLSIPPVVVQKDGPFIVRRDPDSLLLDPDARRLSETRWRAFSDVIKYNDLIASPQFNDRAKAKIKPTAHPVDSDSDKARLKGDRQDQSEKEWVQVYYIWDKDSRKKYTVAEGYDFFLEGDEQEGLDWPYIMEYRGDPFPMSVKAAKVDAASPYSWSEFKSYESQIIELNRIRNAMQIHVKRSLPRYMHLQALGTRDKISKLMNSRSDESTEVDSLDAIRVLDTAEMPADFLKLAEMAKDDLLNVSGLFEYQNQSIADTATEASLIEGRSEVRKSMRTKEWEQFVVEIAAKLAQLCQQHMDIPLAVQIAGPGGVDWLTVSKDQIQGDFYFDIEPGIMEYKNESLRKQQLLKFMELTANDPTINRQKLTAMVAKEMDLPAQDLVNPNPPPAPPPKPTVDFKPIDITLIKDPVVMNAIIMAACAQNQVQIDPRVAAAAQGLPPPPPPGPPAGPAPTDQGNPMAGPEMSGKDAADNGLNPNGNPNLPPVAGNVMEGGGM